MTFIDYLNIVLKHKWKLILSTVICTLIGIAACFLIPKVYESNGKLLISQDNMSLMNNGSPLEDIMLSSLGKSDPLTTQMEILKTRPILNRVISILGLTSEEGIMQPEDLLKRFSFNLVRNTNLIEAKCKSQNADTAALFVNTLMTVFVEKNQQMNQEMISTAKEFIKNQLVEQKLKVEEAEQNLVAFKEKTKIMSLDKETEVNITAYSSLNLEFIRTISELNAALNQQKFYNGKLGEKNSSNDPQYSMRIASLEQIDNVIAGLNAKKIALEQQLLVQKGLMKNAPIIEAQLVSLLREQQISNEIYTGLLSKFEEYKIQEAAKIGSAKIIEPAVPNIKPIVPRKKVLVVLAFMFGISLGLSLLFGIEFLKGLPHSIDEIKKTLGYNVLGTIPYHESIKHMFFAKNDANSMQAEAMRLVQTSLNFKLADGSAVVLITSTQPGEGKSTIATNLAYSCSSYKKVILLNMDFRRPSLGKMLGVDLKAIGVIDVLLDSEKLNNSINSIDKLHVIDTGKVVCNPLDIARSNKMTDFMNTLKIYYELIIIDTAPINLVAETSELLRLADDVIVVVDISSVSLRNLQSVKTRFESRKIEPSIIVNKYHRVKSYKYYDKKY
jgi:capsular exopolysaccharide synthesis family protein